MATVSEAVKALSVTFGEDESFVRQVARRLIDDGQLPKSRGRDLAHVSNEDVSRLILAVLTTDKVNRSGHNALTYWSLRFNGEPDNAAFGLFLAGAIENLRHRKPIEINDDISLWYDRIQFEIVTSYPVAFVRCAADVLDRPKAFDGDLIFAEEGKDARFWPDMKPRKSVTVPGHALFYLGAALDSADARAAAIGRRDEEHE